MPFGSALSGEHIENIKTGYNSLTAETNLTNRSNIFLSIPYSKFWKAKIDGNETEIKLAKTAFMELSVPKGNHHIELSYSNTYFSLGIVVTIAAFFVFLILVFWKKHYAHTNFISPE